jgi:Spy/CpxP family protein refolding chaperone
MKIILVLISILAIGGLILGGCAHRYKDPEKRAEHFSNKISKKLELNAEQKVKLDAVTRAFLTTRTEMKGKKEDTRNTLRDVLSQTKFDQDKVMSVYKNHVNDMNTHAPRIVAALGGFWDSLTPEQQAKAREKMEKHFERHGRWGHKHGHHH